MLGKEERDGAYVETYHYLFLYALKEYRDQGKMPLAMNTLRSLLTLVKQMQS